MNSSNQVLVHSRRNGKHNLGIGYEGQDRLSLNLRQLRYESEMKSMGLPEDLQACIKFQLDLRAETLENKYKQVFAYTQLQKFGSFWEDFGCRSLDEWLATVDLPTGSTLANREVMVRMFSKETFVLIGDDMLGEMMLLICRVQSDTEKRKADYQAIFDAYCKSYTSFDKSKFREILYWYFNTNYSMPAGKKVENIKASPPSELPTGTHYVKVAKPVAEIQSYQEHSAPVVHSSAVPSVAPTTPSVTMDYVVEQRTCLGCRLRDAYIEDLERVIQSKLGKRELPVKPRNI